MATDISICSSALVMAGADAITGWGDDTREAEVAKQLYEDAVRDLLTDYPWRFSMGKVQLARLADAPLEGYDYAYQLPGDALSVISVEGSRSPYEVFGDKLYCDDAEVKVNYQFRPLEARFPAYFTATLILKLAALFSLALLKDESISDKWEARAGVKLAVAKARDSQTQRSGKPYAGQYHLVASRQG